MTPPQFLRAHATDPAHLVISSAPIHAAMVETAFDDALTMLHHELTRRDLWRVTASPLWRPRAAYDVIGILPADSRDRARVQEALARVPDDAPLADVRAAFQHAREGAPWSGGSL